MKKILLNAYLEKNLGDDLFLRILFDRYKNVNWVIDSSKREYKKIFEDYNNVKIAGNFLYKILKRIGLSGIYNKKCDALVLIGGSIFIQYDTWIKQFEERRRLFDLFDKKEKFVIGSNFGVFYDEEFLCKYKNLLKGCTDVCFRDSYSLNLFNDLGNIRLSPDIVFQLKPKNILKEKNTVGISPILLESRKELKDYQELYIKKIIDIVKHFIDNGKKITFFSFCEAQMDVKAINKIINGLDKKYIDDIEIEKYNGDIDSFLLKFESMENIIGTRFHSCILSQVFSQGLYPIIYSDKTYNVLKDIGLDKEYKFIKDLEELDAEHVLKVIDNNKITNKNIFKEAEKQFKRLDEYVGSW